MKILPLSRFLSAFAAVCLGSTQFAAHAEGFRVHEYQFYELKAPLEYKKLILPIGTRIYNLKTCGEGWLKRSCRLKTMPKNDEIDEIRFPEGTTWAGFPLGSLLPYFNRSYKGFQFSNYFRRKFEVDGAYYFGADGEDYYADHTPSARWLNEYVRLTGNSFDTKDNEDWRFNPANLILPESRLGHIPPAVRQRMRQELAKLPVQGLACCDIRTRKHSDGTKADKPMQQ